jgi:hypothetical protein
MHIPPNNSRTPENLTPESGVGVGVDFFSGVGLGSGLPQMLNFYVSKVKLIVGPHLHLVHQVKSIFALSLILFSVRPRRLAENSTNGMFTLAKN